MSRGYWNGSYWSDSKKPRPKSNSDDLWNGWEDWDDYDRSYYGGTGTASTVTTVKPTVKVSKMDTTFDFSTFLAKDLNFGESPEMSATNHVDDASYKKGFLKTVIMAGNGIFEIVDGRYGYSIQDQGNGYPGLGGGYGELANGIFITHNEFDKIPKRALDTVIEWYRRITEENGEEAQVVFYYNEMGETHVKTADGNLIAIQDVPGVKFWTDKLFSYTPVQHNTKAHTEVAANDHYYDEFNNNIGPYVETHSHNSMDAFNSGEDDANSKNNGFQLVFGKLDTDTPVMYHWASMNFVIKVGLTNDDLGFILDDLGTGRRNDGRNFYDVHNLDFDESVFDEWDAQIKPRPVTTYSGGYATGFYGSGSTAYRKPTTVAKTGWGSYTAYQAIPKTVEFDTVYTTFAGNIHVTSGDLVIDGATLETLLANAYMAGYSAKSDFSYVNGMKMHDLENRIVQDADQAISFELEDIDDTDPYNALMESH